MRLHEGRPAPIFQRVERMYLHGAPRDGASATPVELAKFLRKLKRRGQRRLWARLLSPHVASRRAYRHGDSKKGPAPFREPGLSVFVFFLRVLSSCLREVLLRAFFVSFVLRSRSCN